MRNHLLVDVTPCKDLVTKQSIHINRIAVKIVIIITYRSKQVLCYMYCP